MRSVALLVVAAVVEVSFGGRFIAVTRRAEFRNVASLPVDRRTGYVTCEVPVYTDKDNPLLFSVDLQNEPDCVADLADLGYNLFSTTGVSITRRFVVNSTYSCKDAHLSYIAVDEREVTWVFKCNDPIVLTGRRDVIEPWPFMVFGGLLVLIPLAFIIINFFVLRRYLWAAAAAESDQAAGATAFSIYGRPYVIPRANSVAGSGSLSSSGPPAAAVGGDGLKRRRGPLAAADNTLIPRTDTDPTGKSKSDDDKPAKILVPQSELKELESKMVDSEFKTEKLNLDESQVVKSEAKSEADESNKEAADAPAGASAEPPEQSAVQTNQQLSIETQPPGAP